MQLKSIGKILIKIFLLIILSVTTYIFLSYLMKSLYISNKSEKTPEEVLSRTWIKTHYGNPEFVIETPFELKRDVLPLNSDVKNVIDKMDVYSNSTKGLKLLINSIKYKPEAGSIDLRDAADSAIEAALTDKSISDFKYTEEQISKGAIRGILQNATFIKDYLEFESINAIFVSGLNLWHICIYYNTDDELGKTAAKKIIKSIGIEYNQN